MSPAYAPGFPGYCVKYTSRTSCCTSSTNRLLKHALVDQRLSLCFGESRRPKMVSVAKEGLVSTLRERLSDMGVKGVR